jgi:hypothetical protein
VFVNIIVHQIAAVYSTLWSPFLKSGLQGFAPAEVLVVPPEVGVPRTPQESASPLNTALLWMAIEKPCTSSHLRLSKREKKELQ